MRVDGNSSAHHSHGSHHAKKSSGAAGGFFSSLDDASQSTSTGTSANEAFDFTSMTSGEMDDVSDDLFSSGAIDLTQSFKMKTAGNSFGTQGADGSFTPTTGDQASEQNTQTDYIKTVQGILDNIEAKGQANNPNSGYQSWQSVLSLMNSMQGETGEGDAV